MMRSVLAALVVSSLLGGVRIVAHHSFEAEFDGNKPITMQSVITKMEWINPHSWLYIDVKQPDGKVESWAIEFASPGTLISRRGWSRDMLPVGATVTVFGYLAKDGSPRANGRRVTIPSGKLMCASSCGPEWEKQVAEDEAKAKAGQK